MPVLISMLRGVNLVAYNRIKMDALREVYESLGFRDVQTYVQSGNIVFRTNKRDLAALGKCIEQGIQDRFGFRPSVVLRTPAELRDAIARNPFASRRDIEPSKLLVTFLAALPTADACEKLRKLDTAPEQVHLSGRELYIYYPNGQGRTNVPWTTIDRLLKVGGTGRNWNTVTKLLAMTEAMK